MRDGCKLATNYLGHQSSCFDCPFDPECHKDNPRLVKRLMRNRDIISAFKEDKTIEELAVMFSVSKRTVQRVLERCHT